MLLPGYLIGVGGLALITYRTVLAFGTLEKAITIQVNRFGEQYIDLLMLGVLWGICLVGLWSLFRVLKDQQTRMVSSEPGSIGAIEGEIQDCFLQRVDEKIPGISVHSFSTAGHGYVLMKNGERSASSSVSMIVTLENNQEE